MKLNYISKSIPFLSTLLIITFLCINNQKDYTRLRILIWNTPTLKLGNYLALSTGGGFLFSYFITTNLAKINRKRRNELLKYKEDSKYIENIEHLEAKTNPPYDNTLIERDVNDPSPTINANFRIIGKSFRSNRSFIDNSNVQYEPSIEYEDQYDDQVFDKQDKSDEINQIKTISTDWNDESFSSW